MTAEPLPDSWADEPWPLEDPIPSRGLRPTNWSDTHADPPQVADLADEAWQRAVDRGISMGQALAELQREAEFDRAILYGSGSGGAFSGLATGGHVKVATVVPVTRNLLDDMLWSTAIYNPMSFVDIVAEDDQQAAAGDDAFDAVKRITGRRSPGFYLADPEDDE